MTTIIHERAPRSRSANLGLVAASVALAAGVAGVGMLDVRTAEAKTPGSTYCFNQICHRVFTLKAMAALLGREVVHETSYYDGCRQDVFNPCGLTSSGEVFRPRRPDNAASPIYPDGTMLLVYNPETRKAAVVRVNNAGPYWGRRKLDVSRATAEKLGFRKRGIAKLRVMVIGVPSEAEARYRQRRRYDRVPGPIGEYASLDEARRAISNKLLTASSRFAGMRPSDLFNAAIGTGRDDGTASRSDQDEAMVVAALGNAATPRPAVEAGSGGRSALSVLVRPVMTAALMPGRPAFPDQGTGVVVPDAMRPYAGWTETAPGGTARTGTASASARVPAPASALARLQLAALHMPSAPPAALVATLTQEQADDEPSEADETMDAGPAPRAPSDAEATGLVPRVAPTVAVTPADVPEPAATFRSTDRPIEVVAARRLDVLSPDQQTQPVLATLPLEVAADLMERDLSAGRVTLFARSIPLTTLAREPVGRLTLFSRSAASTPAMADGRGTAVARFAVRMSDTVRWSRLQATLATDVLIREPGR